jgi:hypothetical protein
VVDKGGNLVADEGVGGAVSEVDVGRSAEKAVERGLGFDEVETAAVRPDSGSVGRGNKGLLTGRKEGRLGVDTALDEVSQSIFAEFGQDDGAVIRDGVAASGESNQIEAVQGWSWGSRKQGVRARSRRTEVVGVECGGDGSFGEEGLRKAEEEVDDEGRDKSKGGVERVRVDFAVAAEEGNAGGALERIVEAELDFLVDLLAVGEEKGVIVVVFDIGELLANLGTDSESFLEGGAGRDGNNGDEVGGSFGEVKTVHERLEEARSEVVGLGLGAGGGANGREREELEGRFVFLATESYGDEGGRFCHGGRRHGFAWVERSHENSRNRRRRP